MSAAFDGNYRDLYFSETREHLSILERETIGLEHDPTYNRLNTLFRAAHTIKGSSSAMGYEAPAGLTHELESLLDQLRSGEREVDVHVIDALLISVDALGRMLSALDQDADAFPFGVPALDALRKLASPPSEETFQLRVHLSADCSLKYGRVLQAIRVVKDGGALIETIPSAGDLEEEAFGRSFEIIFTHRQSLPQLKERFLRISEIEAVELQNWLPHLDADESMPSLPLIGTSSVRVDVSRLDELMNLVGELVIERARLDQVFREMKAMGDRYAPSVFDVLSQLERVSDSLQHHLLDARMLPVDLVLSRLPRMVRDLAHQMGKQVHVQIAGAETELDRTVIEEIGDPLIHILRNSIDHGIETPSERVASGKPAEGQIAILARHQEGAIVIEITDDGAGVDHKRLRNKAVDLGLLSPEAAQNLSVSEAVSLIFASGFSTAAAVSEVSGRGVGLDIVRANLQRLGGIVDVETELGQWTKFTLRLPLTLAIIRGLLVWSNEVVYVLPISSVVETLVVPASTIQYLHRSEALSLRGATLPLLRLKSIFPTDAESSGDQDRCSVVVVGVAHQRVGIIVDELIGDQEIVIKPLSQVCAGTRGIAGSTILGDGRVALVCDVNSLLNNHWNS